MERTIPKNGLLSGMIITQAAAVVAIIVGLFVPGADHVFAGFPPRFLLDVFLASVVLMTVHKVESYYFGEFEVCPVYLTIGKSWEKNVRRAGFEVFVTAFLGGMFLLALALRGAPWPLLLMSVWLAQGLHEIHHLGKTIARRRYYPGLISALLFTAVIDLAFFPNWYAALNVGSQLGFYAYYAVQPLVLLAFYLEDRKWFTAFRALPQNSDSERTGQVLKAS